MKVLNNVSKSQIFDEFTSEEQKKHFGITERKVLHNIDNLYYTVYLNEENQSKSIQTLIDELEILKGLSLTSGVTEVYKGLQVMPFGIKMYGIRLSLENMYDIYFMKSLINSKTPRVQVQIRSIALWNSSEEEILDETLIKLKEILNGISIVDVVENRIDYAYHTNAIQNTTHYFSDKNLLKYCKTSFGIGSKVFRFGNQITVEYLSLGSRKSNNLFFRAYNKTREVIEENYKGFFIELWHKNGLISAYDKYLFRTRIHIKFI